MPETVLFDYWRSSASYRVRIALHLCNEPFQSVSVDLVKGGQREEVHLERNPQGFVPVLDIDGHRLTQSLAILDYLDRTREMQLLPERADARSRVMALAHAIAVDIHPICNLAVASHVASMTDTDRKTAMTGWMQRFIRPGLQAVEVMLGGFDQTPFACGNSPGLVDICLVPQVYNARRWNVDIHDLPRVLSVDAACAEHPAFTAAHPDRYQPS